jgi:hypothetical protein
MRQNATPKGGALAPNQENALAALLAGKSVTDAAAVAEVDRTTLHRWLKEDFQFQAAWNRGRRDLRQAMEAQLMAMAEKAAKAVASAIDAGDGKTALALLKGLGLLSGDRVSIGSDDPKELAENAAQAKLFRMPLSALT